MTLPKPSGVFGVGCIDLMTKAACIPTDLHPRILCESDLGSFMRLYYPSDASTSTKDKTTWIPGPNQTFYSYALASYAKMGRLVGWAVHWLYKNVKMDAVKNCSLIDQTSWGNQIKNQIIEESEKLPLIIFSHGIGGQRALYSVFCTQLASEGFVVAAIEHRDRSGMATFIVDDSSKPVEISYFPDNAKTQEEKKDFMKLRNEQLEKRTKEVSAALDLLEKLDSTPEDIYNCIETESDLNMFKGRINTSYPLMMGHSFGGATMANALKKEPRLKCGVGLDVWFEPFLDDFFDSPTEKDRKPTFLIFTEYFNFKYNMKRCYSYIKSFATNFIEIVTLKHTRHYDQCDIPGMIPSFVTDIMDKKHDINLPYKDAILSQRKLISDYCWKYFGNKETLEPVKLLNDEYQLDDVFMLGSPIKDEQIAS